MNEKVTLKELARILNVSIATVSKALNDSYDISEETKERVKKKAKELNYVPNVIAQSLKLRKTFTLGVVVPNITDEFFARAINGITKEAKTNNYKVIIIISNEEIKSEVEGINTLLNSNVDGILISLASETQMLQKYDHIQNILDRNVPLVMFDRVTDEIRCDKVTIDDFKSAYDATTFLIRKNCKNFLFMTGISDTSVCELRKKGLEQALLDSKVKVGESLVLSVRNEEYIEAKLKKTLDTHKIDAILCSDEHTAVASLHVVQRLGYKVPDDISVIGFTNSSLTRYTLPSLTAISQHSEKMGKTAVQIMMHRIYKGTSNKDYVLKIIQTDLIERKSTKHKF